MVYCYCLAGHTATPRRAGLSGCKESLQGGNRLAAAAVRHGHIAHTTLRYGTSGRAIRYVWPHYSAATPTPCGAATCAMRPPRRNILTPTVTLSASGPASPPLPPVRRGAPAVSAPPPSATAPGRSRALSGRSRPRPSPRCPQARPSSRPQVSRP